MTTNECDVDCKALVLAQTEAIKGLNSTVTRLDAHIRGNGKPGLTERVRNLEKSDITQKTKAAVWGDRLWKVAVSVGLLIMAITMKG